MVVSLFSDLCASDTNKKNGGFVFDIPICIFLFSDGSCSNFFLSLFSSRFLSFLLHYLDSYGYEPTSQIYVMKKITKRFTFVRCFRNPFCFHIHYLLTSSRWIVFKIVCYPCESGIYPRVFEPDAIHGLLPHETTLAKYLQQRHQYATKIVGKVRMMEGVESVRNFSRLFLSSSIQLLQYWHAEYHCMSGYNKFSSSLYHTTNTFQWYC